MVDPFIKEEAIEVNQLKETNNGGQVILIFSGHPTAHAHILKTSDPITQVDPRLSSAIRNLCVPFFVLLISQPLCTGSVKFSCLLRLISRSDTQKLRYEKNKMIK